jgi:hypothetical protein
LRLDVSVNEVSLTQKVKGARELFEEMPNYHFVESPTGWIGVFGNHVSGR